MSNKGLTLLVHHSQLIAAIKELKDVDLGVLWFMMTLAQSYNVKNGCAFPSRKVLSKNSGYSEAYISYLASMAEKFGFINRIFRFKQVKGEKAPRQISNKYTFNLEKFGLFFSKVKSMITKEKKPKKESKNKKPEWQAKREAQERHVAAQRIRTEQANQEAESFEPVTARNFDIDALKKSLNKIKNAPPK